MPPGPPKLFDRELYRRRRERAARLVASGADDFLTEAIAGQVAERLQAVNREFELALDLDARAQGFAALQPLARQWVRLSPAAIANQDGLSVLGDEEKLPFADNSFDLVVGMLSLQGVNDLPGTLVQIRRVLKPDGLFMGALFGAETLTELRQAFLAAEATTLGGVSPRVFPFADARDMGGLLQRADFRLPVADVERTIVRYADLRRLFADLRVLGETNILHDRSKAPLSRRMLAALTQEYDSRFSDPDGRYRATFDIVFLTGWAAHESQQVPLKPGSARARLADALGTVERPTGEKPG